VFPLVEGLQAGTLLPEAKQQELAENAMKFASKFTTIKPRCAHRRWLLRGGRAAAGPRRLARLQPLLRWRRPRGAQPLTAGAPPAAQVHVLAQGAGGVQEAVPRDGRVPGRGGEPAEGAGQVAAEAQGKRRQEGAGGGAAGGGGGGGGGPGPGADDVAAGGQAGGHPRLPSRPVCNQTWPQCNLRGRVPHACRTSWQAITQLGARARRFSRGWRTLGDGARHR
jgi:hypothetical protein